MRSRKYITTNLEEVYSEWARNYPYVDDQCNKFLDMLSDSGHWAQKHAEIWRLTGKIEGMRILDLGCGIGAHALDYAMAGNECWGIDLLPDMVGAGHKLAAELSLSDHCHILQGDVTRITDYFDNGFFDYVIASDIIEHLSDQQVHRSLVGVERCLKPGGKIIVHTAPSKYYYLFRPTAGKLLILFILGAWMPDRLFSWYVRMIDKVIIRGLYRKDWEFYNHEELHVNCMEPHDVRIHLKKAGLKFITTYAKHIHPNIWREGCLESRWTEKLFGNYSIAARNVYGVGTKSCKQSF